ncbi:sodium:proline symporter [Neokomagataea tanensis]|uniref:Sodium:proline symporter n=1 Tax=Neokomagataea tanensis TaxID=661191 RepID=A0A4Y6V568_9PROT|nr:MULTISPECIES: sodium:solute symporter [Neokomagataea]QDH25199.1 sodium:proline symporter [Neokomagataea tanensis]
MHLTDILIICAYLVLLPCVTIILSRRGSAQDFLSAHHDLPWWAICLSLVATETSTLTFISVPGIGYTDGLVFVGLAVGYFIGRGIVALWFLPLYARGAMTSAYQYLGERFGSKVQHVASGAFLATRLVAESVRLLAGMLPLVWLMGQAGIAVNQVSLLCIIMAATLVYTLFGGLRAVVWSDVIQLVLYAVGAVFCVGLLWPKISRGDWALASASGHLSLFHHTHHVLSDPFTPLAAVVGGTILTVASHGTDQLLVQRLLAAGSLRSARAALIGSAVLVGGLFGVLSLIGVQLWLVHGGVPLSALGLKSDDLFPHFIATGLPAGCAGLLVAGVLSATMGSLSSTLNAMAGVLLTDFGEKPGALLKKLTKALHPRGGALVAARYATVFWAFALVFCALLLGHSDRSAVIIGLTVAGWSYGPTLGAFLYGMCVPTATAGDVLKGLWAGLIGMAAFMGASQLWGFKIAFPWLVPLGVFTMFPVAWLSTKLAKRPKIDLDSDKI